ncbi:hypothetical protein Tco_0111368 [Tanacetum coccineum]
MREGPQEPRGLGPVTTLPPACHHHTPPPVTDPTTTTSVTSAQLQAMINEGVTAALAARDTTRNGDDSHSSGVGIRRPVQVARECTYPDFLKCQPLNFKGTEGVVGLTRWFEKMESLHAIAMAIVEEKRDPINTARGARSRKSRLRCGILSVEPLPGKPRISKQQRDINTEGHMPQGMLTGDNTKDLDLGVLSTPKNANPGANQGRQWLFWNVVLRGPYQEDCRKLQEQQHWGVNRDGNASSDKGVRCCGKYKGKPRENTCRYGSRVLAKGCHVFLANITATKDEDKSKGKRLEDVPVVREFPEVFPEDLPDYARRKLKELAEQTTRNLRDRDFHKTKFLTLGSSSPIRQEERWFFPDVYRLQRIEQIDGKEPLPIPGIESYFDQLHRVSFIQDRYESGYHQLRVREEDILKNSHSGLDYGHYEFPRRKNCIAKFFKCGIQDPQSTIPWTCDGLSSCAVHHILAILKEAKDFMRHTVTLQRRGLGACVDANEKRTEAEAGETSRMEDVGGMLVVNSRSGEEIRTEKLEFPRTDGTLCLKWQDDLDSHQFLEVTSKALGTSLDMSTAFHPETERQVRDYPNSRGFGFATYHASIKAEPLSTLWSGNVVHLFAGLGTCGLGKFNSWSRSSARKQGENHSSQAKDASRSAIRQKSTPRKTSTIEAKRVPDCSRFDGTLGEALSLRGGSEDSVRRNIHTLHQGPHHRQVQCHTALRTRLI